MFKQVFMKMCLQSKGAVVKLLKPVVLGGFSRFLSTTQALIMRPHMQHLLPCTLRILHSINARLHETAVAYYSVSRSVACPFANGQRTRFL